MEIRIKDKRSGRFMVDNVIIDEYGGKLGSTGLALYMVLCRHASNATQECWPSLEKIREETGMKRNTIVDAGKLLIDLKLISKEVVPGRWAIYTLLEPTSTEKDTGTQKVTTNQYPNSIDQYPNGYYTSTEKGTQRNLENELIKGTKERTKDVYDKKLERNTDGMPVFI